MTQEQIKAKAKEQFPNDEFKQQAVIDAINWAIKGLKKENAELKKNYEDSLVACGVLKEKIDLLSKPSPVEAMQDVLITTQKEANKKQNDQLTKAKEIMNIAIEGIKHWGIVGGTERPFEKQAEKLFNLFLEKAEQFLKENA